jgi:putative CocE/NonD family hydrolase
VTLSIQRREGPTPKSPAPKSKNVANRPAFLSLRLSFPIFAGLALDLSAQTPVDRSAERATLQAKYTKAEVQIPLRDGAALYTAIYAPRDTTRSYPILLVRTASGVFPKGSDQYPAQLGPAQRFSEEGFIFAYQETRGPARESILFNPRRGPKGVDESTDAYDTIEWLVKNLPRNNGRVGTWGVSEGGIFAMAGMIDAHPALKAVSPQAASLDRYFSGDFHYNGALTLARTFPAPETVIRANPDGYRFFLGMGPNSSGTKYLLDGETATSQSHPPHSKLAFWDSVMVHPNYDELWMKTSLASDLAHIKPAVLLLGGWYDTETLDGSARISKAMDTLSAETAKTLVVGPWSHGAWGYGVLDHYGPIAFGHATGPFVRDSIEFPFFACALEDRCDAKLARAIMYETGANSWRVFDQWPPRSVTPRQLYLRANGALSFDAPTDAAAADSYVSDPARPVPYTMSMSFGLFQGYVVEDQRFATGRPDVLVYETTPLETDLTLAGPISVSLKVSTSGTDADFIVKLIDVYPAGESFGGYQQLVQGNVFRARWRESYTHPKPMLPGKPTAIEYALPDVFHTFKTGHRLMVHVQSTWFPLFDRNPQIYVTNINAARGSDFKPATMRVYRSKQLATYLTLPILPRPQLVR